MSDIEKFFKKEEETQFLAVSNIYPDKLKKTLELGLNGLCCPSIQIKPIPNKFKDNLDISDKDSLFDFGDISFVFNKQNIFGKHKTIPKNDATHQIFTGDAYTLVFPEVTYSTHIKSMNQFSNKLLEMYQKEECYLHDEYDIILGRKNRNKHRIFENLQNSITVKLLFLKENDLFDEMKVFKTREIDERTNKKKINKNKTNLLLRRLVKKAEKVSHQTFEQFLMYELNQFLHSPKIENTQKEANLENITDWMKKNRGAGAEQGSFGGLNRTAAKTRHILRSVDDMIDKKSYILSKEEYKIQQNEISKKKGQIFDINYTQDIGLSLEKIYEIIDFRTYNKNEESFNKKLISSGLNLDKHSEFISNIKELSTMTSISDHLYFEAKPNKAFYFNSEYVNEDQQIEYVIVPNNVDKEILKQLEKTDLKIITYNHKSPESRMRAFYKCKNSFIKEESTLKIENKKQKKIKI